MSYTKRGGTEFLGNWKIGDTEYSLLEQVKPLLDAGVTDGVVKSVNGIEPDANGNVEVLATDRVLLQRPVSDLALYPVVYASEDGKFDNALVIDSLNNETDREYLKVFSGESWIDFPESGLGSPFDLKEVAVDVSKFSELVQPYYIKYCWVDAEGTMSTYRALEYPASTTVAIKSGTVNSVNGIKPDSDGNVEITLTDSVDESRLLPKDASDGDIAVYDEASGVWKATANNDSGVKTVNGVEPDNNGNIAIDIGVQAVASISPDAEGNVDGSELRSALGAVTSVNGIEPDNQGGIELDIPEVDESRLLPTGASDRDLAIYEESSKSWQTIASGEFGTVKSINGIQPDENGNINIENSEGTVKSVAGIDPDDDGNVDGDALASALKVVKSVNGVEPDASGNVEISVSGEVDESRLLPEDANEGDLAIKTAGGNDSNTILLLHFDEDEGTPVDSSKSAIEITPYSTEVDTNIAKFGNARNLNKSYLGMTIPALGELGTGDFTFDGWFYFDSLGTRRGLFGGPEYTLFCTLWGDNTFGVFLSSTNTGWTYNYGDSKRSSVTATTGWHHIALVRYNSQITLYLDGSNILSFEVSADASLPDVFGTKEFGIGQKLNGMDYTNDRVDEFRISNVARWTEDFTPPEKAYSSGDWVAISPNDLGITSEGGTNINHLIIQRPTSDLALYPYVEASESPDYDDSLEIDLYDDFEGNASYCKVFNGDVWMAIPKSGLGTPFDGDEVEIELTKFEGLSQPYYLRYGWVTSDGAYSNYKGLMFPSVSCTSNSSSSSSNNPSWVELVNSSTLNLNASSGELQKVTLSQNCTITAPTLSSSNQTLLLQITSSTSITVSVGSTTIVSDWVGTMQIGWFWDGSTTRRYPAVQLEA